VHSAAAAVHMGYLRRIIKLLTLTVIVNSPFIYHQINPGIHPVEMRQTRVFRNIRKQRRKNVFEARRSILGEYHGAPAVLSTHYDLNANYWGVSSGHNIIAHLTNESGKNHSSVFEI
jgi:hypothetical protein